MVGELRRDRRAWFGRQDDQATVVMEKKRLKYESQFEVEGSTLEVHEVL